MVRHSRRWLLGRHRRLCDGRCLRGGVYQRCHAPDRAGLICGISGCRGWIRGMSAHRGWVLVARGVRALCVQQVVSVRPGCLTWSLQQLTAADRYG